MTSQLEAEELVDRLLLILLAYPESLEVHRLLEQVREVRRGIEMVMQRGGH